jgi:PIN like domain
VSVVDERADVLDRFSTALYTVPEAARYLDVPTSTLSSWAHGYRNRPPGRREVVGAPILTTVPRHALRLPIIPFIGLAEGAVLTAIRRSGVPMQRIRPALEQLDTQIGLSHALASRRLYTDGAEVLFDYAEATDDPDLLRAAGLHLHTLAEVYGIPADETIADVDWLARAGHEGWVVLMKDERIRYVQPNAPHSSTTVCEHSV